MENLRPSICLNSFAYLLSFDRSRDYLAGLSLDLGQPLGLPAKAYPLADVIGQTSPHGFQGHFNQSTQTELTQPNFILNPRIGKFRHSGPLLIDSLSFRRLHLGLKGCYLRRRLAPYHRSPSLRSRATLGLKGTAAALRRLRSVAASHRSPLPLLKSALLNEPAPQRSPRLTSPPPVAPPLTSAGASTHTGETAINSMINPFAPTLRIATS